MNGLSQPNVLDWGLFVIVLYSLLQVPLVLYLSRYVESDEGPIHGVEFYGVGPDDAPQLPERGYDRDDDRSRDARNADCRSFDFPVIACPACGVENDPAFTFCRVCVTRLSGVDPVVGRDPPRESF